MLHAVAVLELQLTPSGHIQHLDWMRAPQHAPQVMADIEQIVRAAAPFPPTRQAGNFRYIETWLWDASGQFQLRTLTEGQRASD